MRLGLGELRLPPEQFWRMTLRELVAAFGTPDPTFNRQRMTDLMQHFPD
jgi:uncharacterized phage protein (TIGR02216 family)